MRFFGSTEIFLQFYQEDIDSRNTYNKENDP